MRQGVVLAVLMAASMACATAHARDDQINPADIERVAQRFYMMQTTGTPGQPDYRLLYCDQAGHLHVEKIEDGALVPDWESTTLGSRATSLFVTDLYGDGKQKIVLSTIAGRVLIYDMATYQLEWENLQLRYNRIDFMAPANLDNDPQEEVVILADDHLYIFDGYNRNIQWSSTVAMPATYLAIGNVDDDPQLEIVLNSGKIIDSRFYNIQFQTDKPFGDRIELLDITGDGYNDVVGEFTDRSLKVFDVWRTREVW
ncbi:MAG TPA: hypothetical protein VFH88_07130 [Candidatus Krumholzibacteria bacterium]|nr:hypothetical protein [Candidatus Krumholzibacteria bacterium]